MKKFSSLILGVVTFIMPFIPSVRAVTPGIPEVEELGVQDTRIADFIHNRVWPNKDKFVYSTERTDNLTDEFDEDNAVCRMTRSEAIAAHAAEVNRVLDEGKEVMYNDKILSDWVFYELRKRGVECEQLTIGWGEPMCKYNSVIIPQVVNDDTEWYVCDIFGMCIFREYGEIDSDGLIFYPIKHYFDMFGNDFRGAVVNDKEYRHFRDGKGVIGGKEFFCWLSKRSGYTAIDMLANQKISSLRFMVSPNHYEKDFRRFVRLKDIAELSKRIEYMFLY